MRISLEIVPKIRKGVLPRILLGVSREISFGAPPIPLIVSLVIVLEVPLGFA